MLRMRVFDVLSAVSVLLSLSAAVAPSLAEATPPPSPRASVPVSASSRYAGIWEGRAPAPGGVTLPLFIDLSYDGSGNLTGRVRMTWGFVPIRSTSVMNDRIMIEFGPEFLPLKIEGKLIKNELAVALYDPRTTPLSFHAHRIPALPLPPPRLPLPALAETQPTSSSPRRLSGGIAGTSSTIRSMTSQYGKLPTPWLRRGFATSAIAMS